MEANGQIRYFGVSNHTAAQIDLLRKSVKQPLIANQVELNVVHANLIDEGVVFNQDYPPYPLRGDGTLDYCRLHDITLQAWAPVAGGTIVSESGASDGRVAESREVIAALAREKNVSRDAIAIAWLLKHPAHIQPILGTTRPERVRAACQGDTVELTREEWYRLFIAGRGAPMP